MPDEGALRILAVERDPMTGAPAGTQGIKIKEVEVRDVLLEVEGSPSAKCLAGTARTVQAQS